MEREAYPADMEAVISEAAEHGNALEINAYPLRLDLSDTWARAANRRGVPLVISTDAHVLDQLGYMTYGVAIARRAWLSPGDVLNTLSLRDLEKRLAAMRGRSGSGGRISRGG